MQSTETQVGTWVSYSAGEGVVLAIILLAIAATLVLTARRLQRPLEAGRPGRALTTLVVIVWLLSILTFLVCYTVELEQAVNVYPGLLEAVPIDPITPVTDTLVVVTFVIVFGVVYSRPGAGVRVAFVSATMAALAAPLVFELPFDLIVIARTYPPIPPNPTLYRLLFFAPLILVEVSTFAVLGLTPMVRVSRSPVVALAAMFTVFALWAALFGFAYPGSAGPYSLNITAKALAFVAVISLFVPEGWSGVRAALAARKERPWVPPPAGL